MSRRPTPTPPWLLVPGLFFFGMSVGFVITLFAALACISILHPGLTGEASGLAGAAAWLIASVGALVGGVAFVTPALRRREGDAGRLDACAALGWLLLTAYVLVTFSVGQGMKEWREYKIVRAIERNEASQRTAPGR